LEFSEGAKEVVASPADYRADPDWVADRAWRELGAGAFYLYSFLITIMDRSKQWETLVAILSGLIILYWFKHYNGLLIAAALTGTLSLLVPAIGGGIHWGWTKLADVLGWVSGKAVLTVVYLFILLPLALFARLTGKLTLRLKPGGDSYFKSRDHTYTKDDLTHPW
jgi:hypothetical protein